MTVANGDALIKVSTLSANRLKPSAEILSTQLAQRTSRRVQIPLYAWRVWDALGSNLPSVSATDDLGYIAGTFGTDGPYIGTSDLKAAGATTRYARCQVALPFEYDDGATVTLRCFAGMLTTVADATATLDAEVYESDMDATISADLCTTAATTINSLTFANIDFVITPSALVAGDVLDIRLAMAINDAAGITAVIGAIGNTELLIDTRG